MHINNFTHVSVPLPLLSKLTNLLYSRNIWLWETKSKLYKNIKQS